MHSKVVDRCVVRISASARDVTFSPATARVHGSSGDGDSNGSSVLMAERLGSVLIRRGAVGCTKTWAGLRKRSLESWHTRR